MPVSGRRIRSRALVALIATLALIALVAGSASALVAPNGPLSSSHLPFQVNADLSDDSTENTSVLVQNNSAGIATMVMDFHTPAGVQIPLASQIHTKVPAWGTRTFEQAFNTGLLPGFRGVGVISSDQPMNALLLREVRGRGGLRSYSMQDAAAAGGTRVVLPYVANQLEGEVEGETVNTRFSIANAGLETACATITYTLMPGRGATSEIGSTTLSQSGIASEACPAGGIEIPVAGQLSRVAESEDNAFAMPAGTVNALMTVAIDSTQPVVVTADIYRGDAGSAQLGSYNGFTVIGDGSSEDDISKTTIMPLAQKTADGYWTEFAIANPWDEVVRGSIVYTGTVDGRPKRTVEVTVPIELPAGGGLTHSVLDSDRLPRDFVGSAVIEAELPVAGLLLRGKTASLGSSEHEAPFSAANGAPEGRTTMSVKLPLIFRQAHAREDGNGKNSWVSVAVVGGGTVELKIVAVNNPNSGAKGCEFPALYRTTITIENSVLLDQSADDRSENGLNAIPNCVTGAMVITSDKRIVALGAVTSDLQAGDNDALYNAFR